MAATIATITLYANLRDEYGTPREITVTCDGSLRDLVAHQRHHHRGGRSGCTFTFQFAFLRE